MEESSALTEDYRQLSNGQLAIAGVSIAVISMILEFIALSGFSPRYVLYLVFLSFDKTFFNQKLFIEFNSNVKDFFDFILVSESL